MFRLCINIVHGDICVYNIYNAGGHTLMSELQHYWSKERGLASMTAERYTLDTRRKAHEQLTHALLLVFDHLTKMSSAAALDVENNSHRIRQIARVNTERFVLLR